MMWHHFKKAPVFVSIDNYKNFDAYLPVDETMENLFTKRDLEKRWGLSWEVWLLKMRYAAMTQRQSAHRTTLWRRLLLQGRWLWNTDLARQLKTLCLIALQDFALTSGKEIFDDVQKILDNVKTETEGFISKNKEALNRLVKKLEDNVLMNGDAIAGFLMRTPWYESQN